MKNLLLFLALGFAAGASAQKLKEADVPAAVKAKFQSLYPNTAVAEWEKEGTYYEAEFEKNNMETSVVIDGMGNLVETETEIPVSELPKAVSDYAAKNMPGKKIKEASKITDASGKITFEAEIGHDGYLFDSNGNFLSKETDDDKDDDDKD